MAAVTRAVIDRRAVTVAAARGCSCGGARNCGCWNLALRLVGEGTRSWLEVEPAEAAVLSAQELELIERPVNELGEACPWPWEPQQLVGAPLGQFHCAYCGGMVIAGVPHLDYRGVEL